MFSAKSKVAIVGCGRVGSTAAYALMMDGIVSQIAMIDKESDRAEGEALDLLHGLQFTSTSEIVAGDSFDLVRDAQIVVIAAGEAQKPGQTRDDLIDSNVKIFSEIVPEIVKRNNSCIFLVVTNPLDVMTYLTWKLSGFPRCRVIGTGTVLDTARLRYAIAKKAEVSPKDVCAHILGEHGDRSFAWCSRASVAGVSLDQFPQLTCQFMEEVEKEVRNAAYEVIEKKGATFFSIALVIAKLVRAILLNQSRVFSVSTILENYMNVTDVALSVPTIVRASGVCKNLVVDLNDQEVVQFSASVAAVSSGVERAMKSLQK